MRHSSAGIQVSKKFRPADFASIELRQFTVECRRLPARLRRPTRTGRQTHDGAPTGLTRWHKLIDSQLVSHKAVDLQIGRFKLAV